MIGKILCAGVLSAALILLPNPNSGEHVKNSEQAAASKVGTMRQQRAETSDDSKTRSPKILTTEAGTQVQQSKRKVPENAPTKPIAAVESEKPNSEPESTARQVKPAVPSEVTQATGCEKYRDIIDNYSWNVNVAIAVCNAESSGNANTANLNDYHSFAGCRGSFGLFQINCSHGKVYDPVENIRIAAAMYEASKWQPWSATTCKYKVKCY